MHEMWMSEEVKSKRDRVRGFWVFVLSEIYFRHYSNIKDRQGTKVIRESSKGGFVVSQVRRQGRETDSWTTQPSKEFPKTFFYYHAKIIRDQFASAMHHLHPYTYLHTLTYSQVFLPWTFTHAVFISRYMHPDKKWIRKWYTDLHFFCREEILRFHNSTRACAWICKNGEMIDSEGQKNFQ